MSHSRENLCTLQPAARWKKQCYQKKTCSIPSVPSPQHYYYCEASFWGNTVFCLMYFFSCQDGSLYQWAGWNHLQYPIPTLYPLVLMFKSWYQGAWSCLLLLHSCHHPTTRTVPPDLTPEANHSSFKFLPPLSQLRMAKWRGQPGTIYTIIGMEISQSVGKYQSAGKRDRSSQRSPLFFQHNCFHSSLLAAPFHIHSVPQQMFTVFKENVFNKYERGDISFNHHRLFWPVTSFPSSDCKRGLVPLL